MRMYGIVIVGMLVAGMFFPLCNVSAAGEDFLEVPEDHRNVGVFYLGDSGVTFSVYVNNKEHDGWWGPLDDITLYNATAKITKVTDLQGNTVTSPFIPVKAKVDNDGLGYTVGDTFTFPNFEYDISTEGVPMTYMLHLEFTYKYTPRGGSSQVSTAESTADDVIYIEIKAGVDIDSQITVLEESGATANHYLYAGMGFQKMAVDIYPVVSTVGEVRATLDLTCAECTSQDGMTKTSSVITLDKPTAYCRKVNRYHTTAFMYRVDVADGTPPGRYTAMMTVEYIRNYDDGDETNDLSITASEVPVELIVDFTPILELDSEQPIQINQGEMDTDLTDVVFRNTGNAELKNLDIWIEISNYFEESGFYYDGNGGDRVLIPTIGTISSIPVGDTVSLTFSDISLFKYLPPGEHRIPVRYSGYFYDDGTVGGSTDYRQTTEADHYLIKGEELYIPVEVTDTDMDVDAECLSSIYLGTHMKDVSITVQITNREMIALQYAEVSLSTTSETGSQVLVNPQDPTAATLEPVETTVPADSTVAVVFNADVHQGATAGFYDMPLTISAVRSDTKGAVTIDLVVRLRVNPEPPRVVVAEYFTSDIKPGKDFTLSLQLRNDGGAVARDVKVYLTDRTGATVTVINSDFIPDAAKAEDALHPFYTRISQVYVGDIAPGETKNVTINMSADRQAVNGKVYQERVNMAYTDDFNRGSTDYTDISLQVRGSIPERAPDYSGITDPLIVGIVLIIVVFVLVVIGDRLLRRPRYGSPKHFESLAPEKPTVEGGFRTAPPVSGEKICQKCGATIPADATVCPRCNSPV